MGFPGGASGKEPACNAGDIRDVAPVSQEDLESEISEDSDQEVDIEGDKGYFNAG